MVLGLNSPGGADAHCPAVASTTNSAAPSARRPSIPIKAVRPRAVSKTGMQSVGAKLIIETC
jgi:hypothetical protein